MEPQEASSQQVTPRQPWQQRVFAWSIRNKSLIFWSIRAIYAVIVLIYFLAAFLIFNNPENIGFYYELGEMMGKMAICLLGVVVLPGILGRFGVRWQATRAITFYRRQLGITVFLLAFTHYSILRLLPMLSGQVSFVFPYSLFEMFGLSAFSIISVMYVTSNNWSMKKMGAWWKRLHRFIYLVLWLLVVHTGLQEVGIWSISIFIVAVIEVASLIYDWSKKSSVE